MDNQDELIVGVAPETQSVEALLHGNPPSATDLLGPALFLRSHGFNVLPVIGKSPESFGKWTKFYSRLQTLEELEAYKWKRATGIAIVLGPGDIHSIDIDDVKDESIVSELLTLLGLPPQYEWVEKTGCGFQVFFLCTEKSEVKVDARDCSDARASHFELRWKNCISVAPPSDHYDKQEPPQPDGKFYSWTHETPFHKPSEISKEVAEKAYKALTKEKPRTPVKESRGDFDDTNTMGQAISKFDMRAFLTAQEFNWWDERDGQVRIEYQPGHKSLVWSDELHCAKFWKDGKTMNLLDTLEYLEACKAGTEPLGFKVLGDREKQGIKEQLQKYSGVSLEVKLKIVEKKGIRVWDKDELKNANIPDLVELIEAVMSDEGVYLFAGQDKAGKSLLGMNLALSIASDRPTFLSWNIKKHGPVVYWNNELSDRQMMRRLKQMDIPTSHPVKFINEKGVRFDENIEEILKICKQYEPVLVIVDCHYRTTTKDKDYGNAIQAVLENYGRIKEEVGCALLVIHHTKKSARGERAGSEQAMGSHTFAMSSDGNFQLKRSETDPEKRILFDTGSRDFSDFKPRLIQLNEWNLWFQDLGECNEDDHGMEDGKVRKKTIDYPVRVLEEAGGQMKKEELLKAIMDKYGIKEKMAYRHIQTSAREDKIAESAGGIIALVRTNVPASEAVSKPIPELVLEG